MRQEQDYWLRDMLELVGVTNLDEYNNGFFHGRYVRVTINGKVQIDDGDMDRWANSVGAGFYPASAKKSRRDTKFFRDFNNMLVKAGVPKHQLVLGKI